nr:uncharacterized protein LOC113840750 isoform X4 [Anas platyrhynchos]
MGKAVSFWPCHPAAGPLYWSDHSGHLQLSRISGAWRWVPKMNVSCGKRWEERSELFPHGSPCEAPGEQILPALACSWFCHLAITNACLGNPSAFSPGNNQAPVLYLNASSAQEGEIVLLQCTLDEQFPPTRVVFCKNGLEEFSLKAQQGMLIYTLVLNITSRSAGMYTCGYQQKNKENWVRSSALSAPWTLSVAGAGAGETTTDIQSSTAPHARILHTLPTATVLAVAAVGLVLLAAGSWFAIRKGACRGRCPRQQHVDRPQTEDTNYGDIQCEYYLLPWGKPHAPLHMGILYSTIAHVRRDRPRPMQHMRNTTTYATVTRTQIR